MPPNDAVMARAAIAAAALAIALFVAAAARAAPAIGPSSSAATSPSSSPASFSSELDAARQQCIADARLTQEREQTIAEFAHSIDLLGRDAAGRQRGLDESRLVQEHLLGTLEFLARALPDQTAAAAEAPIDRRRSELLIQAAVPALRAQGHALSAEFARIAALHREVAATQANLAAAREALVGDRVRVAQAVSLRLALRRQMLPDGAAKDAGDAAHVARLGQDAKDIDALIKDADAATERRDRALLARARAGLSRAKASAVTLQIADPTRPRGLRAFDPPQSALLMPVSGTISQPFGAADAANAVPQSLGFSAMPGAEVVAPFDGRIVYAGPFRDLGLVLIIQHTPLYHSLLAGLGRVDVRVGEWVLAGEPLGTMPDTGDKAVGGVLHYELRHDGRPVDPQPWLATRDAGHDQTYGDQKVRE